MKTNKRSLALAIGCLLASGAAISQTSPVRPAYQFPSSPDGKGPSAVQLGSSAVYASPFVGVAFGNDSNVTLANTNEIDSAFQVYSGGVNLDARDANSVFNMRLLAASGHYSDSSADNYTDSSARGTYDVAFDPRNFLRLGWDHTRGHDPRGSTDRGIQSDPDEYFVNTPNVTYSYGAPGADGRFEVFASRAAKRYLNNRATTIGSDRNTKDYGAAFYWRVAPKTQLILEGRGTDIHYLFSDSTLSGNEGRYYAGVTWEATAATSGTVKFGRLEKHFDSDTMQDYKGTSWEAMVSWLPRSYSKFDLYSSRQPIESTGLGNFILSDASGIVWTHGWNSLFSTEASARYQKDDYKGFDRNDDITGVGLKANYKFRRWLTLGAEYQYTKRDSNLNVFDYDKNLWLITAVMSM